MAESLTTLVAEADPDDAFLFKLALAKAGAEGRSYFVDDGTDVINYLLARQRFADRARYPFPNLLVLALKIPGMTGLEVLAWLRGEPRLRPALVAVLTGVGRPEDLDQANALGADYCIAKPCNFEQLTVVANRLVQDCAARLTTIASRTNSAGLRSAT
jgi:CheY-like chemotaxis protein